MYVRRCVIFLLLVSLTMASSVSAAPLGTSPIDQANWVKGRVPTEHSADSVTPSTSPGLSAVEDSEQALSAGVSNDWWATVQQNIRQSEYHITWQDQTYLPEVDAAYQAPNRAHNLRTYFTSEGPVVIPRVWSEGVEAPPWRWGLRLVAWGREGALQPVGAATLQSEANRIKYRWGTPSASSGQDLVEWYVNDERGLEQGFTLAAAPEAQILNLKAQVVLELALTGDLTPHLTDDGTAIKFTTSDGVSALRYSDLHATDATGRELSARLELTQSRITQHALRIIVDDSNAVYPITIDPLTTTPNWTAAGDSFGSSVGTAGDVNGDGYSDVIVGADEYDNGQVNEGAAFVWYGSATGLGADGTPANADWMAESNDQAASFGSSVGTVGDVNGDGCSDVIVGADHYSNGQEDEGAVFVWYGSDSGLGSNGTPSNADWRAESNLGYAEFGWSVGTAGDVNGDSYSDVIVGAPSYFDDGQTYEGAAFVWYGSDSGLGSNGTPSNADWQAESNLADTYFGRSVATAGDVNGDGYADVIVGAAGVGDPRDGEDQGGAYVWYGSNSGLGLNGTLANADWTAEKGGYFGYSVATAGDVNGDGYADIIVGAHSYYIVVSTYNGWVFVWYGSETGLGDPANADWHYAGTAYAHLGHSVSTAGDVNGDGYADIIVGAYNHANGQDHEGAAFVWYGSAFGMDTYDADWSVEGNQSDAHFGHSVATAGDVNGDGYSDVIVGTPDYDTGGTHDGAAFVYQGSASGPNPSGWYPTHLLFFESDQNNAYFGHSVATAGDVNGDGYADFIVGADQYDNGQTDEGRAFVYYGAASMLGRPADWTAESNQGSAHFGTSVGTAGDVNGDGYADVIVGAYWYDNGETEEGAAFVWYGSSSGLGDPGTPTNADWTAESNQEDARLGDSAGTAGDVNGDGYADVIVGAYRYDNDETDEGAAFVWYGSSSGLGDPGTPTNAGWTAESDQADARFGDSVGTAGDVNGDGYSDVIVGASYWNDEGGAWVYHGSDSGLNTAPAWTKASGHDGDQFGYSVGTAGDVNGDGYADVIVGAPYWAGQGAAFVYPGSASGLSTAPAWNKVSGQSGASFGRSVATAGDVNGDGYADVIVGAPDWSSGPAGEGGAWIYHGSASGLHTVPDWHIVGGQAIAFLGVSVGTAGDVNGDGYADVIVGAYRYNNGETDEGRAYVYYGNGNARAGLSPNPRQRRGDDSAPIAHLGLSDSNTIRLALLGRTPFGRGKVKLEWEIEPLGTLFDGSGTQQSVAWQDTGTAGVELSELVPYLSAGTAYHWRVRLRYHPATTPFQQHSRWLTMPWNGWQEQDLRITGGHGGGGTVNYIPVILKNQ